MSRHVIKNTSSGTLGSDLIYTTGFNNDWALHSVSIHFSDSYNKTVTLTIDSGTGSNYDVILFREEVKSDEDFLYMPDSDLLFANDDQIKVTVEEKTGSVTAYITVMGELV